MHILGFPAVDLTVRLEHLFSTEADFMDKQENLKTYLSQYCIHKCGFLNGGMSMPIATVRISKGTKDTLRDLAVTSGESMQTIIDRAIEGYRRQSFIEQANKAYSALRENPEAWETDLKERLEWEATLADNQSINK